MPSDRRVIIELGRGEKAEPPEPEYRAWRPGVVHTPGDYVRRGVWLWWRSVVESVRESWQEANRATYGGCSHPVGMREYIAWRNEMKCGCCGRFCVLRDIGQGRERWYLDGEQDEASGCFKPRIYES